MSVNDGFIMLPKNDFAFKLLFGNKQNSNLLIDLLAAILKKDKAQLNDIEYAQRNWQESNSENELGVLWLQVKQADGMQINIGLQIHPTQSTLERLMFYWSQMYLAQEDKNTPCIAINIVNFAVTELAKPHSSWHITEDRIGQRLNDIFEMHFLELPKIGQGEEKIEERLMDWMQFLAADSREVLEMLAQKNDVYKVAYEELEAMSMDEKTRAQYEAREAWLKDEATRQYEAKMAGIEEGMKEAARNFLAQGVDVVVVAKATGLSREEILAFGDK